jgi:hypothetical protein
VSIGRRHVESQLTHSLAVTAHEQECGALVMVAGPGGGERWLTHPTPIEEVSWWIFYGGWIG